MTFIGFSRPKEQLTSALVSVGDIAPPSSALCATERLRVVAFIRHVGCPFAENTVKQLREWAERHPHVAIFVVSHGDAAAVAEWIGAIGGLGSLRLVVDTRRELHGQWGVGYSSLGHVVGLPSLLGAFTLLFKGIHNRSASGTRWQRSATFMADGDRIVWSHLPRYAQEFALPPEHLVR